MRATPLTIISPIRWWWRPWVRFTWLVARYVPLVAAPLRRLAFIHFARWALMPRRRMLFLTSFDGSDIQYIEAFVRVVPGRIDGLYRGAKGFPGPRRFGPVARYIEDHSHPVDHFWMAHPEASTRMVSQALALASAYDLFEARLDGADDAQAFAREWRRFLTVSQGLL
jgi:hypothetical protein